MSAVPDLQAATSRPPYRGEERRASKRLQVFLPAKLELMDGEFDCAIEDISQTGARLIADAPLRKDQIGVLRCQRLDALFRVVWTSANTAGIEFDEPISLGMVRLLRWDNDVNRAVHDAKLRAMVRGWTGAQPKDDPGDDRKSSR